MRAGPSGEERCTPHYMVPISPQCPQEICLLTLPVFQGAAVSSERFSQSLTPRNVAELGGSPPLRGSLEQLDRPSPAGPPLQGTELAALSTPETSLERLKFRKLSSSTCLTPDPRTGGHERSKDAYSFPITGSS